MCNSCLSLSFCLLTAVIGSLYQLLYIIVYQTDMQGGVHGRFMDQSTSVREAAIELVGKFILVRPELTAQYYDMLSERILVSFVIH